MLSREILDQYFLALKTRNGELAASLFTEEGVIDDFKGKHHAGRNAIAAFIGQVPSLDLEFPHAPAMHSRGATVYGHILYPGNEPVLVRWTFISDNGHISHLINSRIEHVPEQLL